MSINRRKLLEQTGVLGMGLMGAHILPGCSSENWWMEWNYGPVRTDLDSDRLRVIGKIPDGLNGLYLRNGPDPLFEASRHWFLGHGMVHGVRIQDGDALWYAGRRVETPRTDPNYTPPPGPPPPEENFANVSVINHGGKLLTLSEVGYPYELSKNDLSTIGVFNWDGNVQTNVTAHPKVDPETGDLHFFGYSFAPPFLTYHLADSDGNHIRSEAIDMPRGPSMIHDLAITKSFIIFPDLPIVPDPTISGFPQKWDASHGARFGIMPKNGGNQDVKWFEIENCYIFHFVNAYENEDGTKITIDCARYPELWVNGNTTFSPQAQLYRYEIDLQTGAVKEKQLDDRRIEFPQINLKQVGKQQRYAYALDLVPSQAGYGFLRTGSIIKYDFKRNTSSIHRLPAGSQPDETYFVHSGNSMKEDDGWLLSYVYSPLTHKSELIILDASDMSRPALARIKLPRRVPFGFHGTFVPEAEL